MIAPGTGELAGDSPGRRVEILSDHDSLHATWTRFGPGRDGAALHVHRHHWDLFYVLDGELTLKLGPGGDEVAVTAGHLVRVPPLVVHGFRNASSADVRYLNLHAPGAGFAGFLRGLRDGTGETFDQHDPPADGGRSPEQAVIGRGDLIESEGGRRVWRLAEVETITVLETWCEPGVAPLAAADSARLECRYVLEGLVGISLGGEVAGAEAGTWVRAPTGSVPGLTFPGPEPARFLSFSAPL